MRDLGREAENAAVLAKMPPAETVRQQLEKVLASRAFRAAKGQKNFLRYAVEQTIAGRGNEIKEYSVGVEVFNRGESFDPRLDPIVRIEARNLRLRLAKYYLGEGEHDDLRIEFSKGSYAPSFRAIVLSDQNDAPADHARLNFPHHFNLPRNASPLMFVACCKVEHGFWRGCRWR